MPKMRVEFWRDKFDRNVERDNRKERQLREAGWDVLTIWECETKETLALKNKLESWLRLPPN